MAINMNKPTNRAAELMIRLKRAKFDPLEEILDVLKKDPDIKSMDKVRVCQELMGYIYPKMKAYELDMKAGQPVVFNFKIDGQSTSK